MLGEVLSCHERQLVNGHRDVMFLSCRRSLLGPLSVVVEVIAAFAAAADAVVADFFVCMCVLVIVAVIVELWLSSMLCLLLMSFVVDHASACDR